MFFFRCSNKNYTSKKEDSIQGLYYKNLSGRMHCEPSPPMEVKKLPQSVGSVFGATLNGVEKDEHLVYVPKFVVECVRIIELHDNIRTNGIYRASGKKESIDKLRKRVRFKQFYLCNLILFVFIETFPNDYYE